MVRWAAVLAGWALSAVVWGADWPQWGGTDPGRNMVSPETNLPASFEPVKPDKGEALAFAPAPQVRWVARIGKYIYGNPVVAGGKVFVGTDNSEAAPGRFKNPPTGRVLCLEEATGKLLWELNIPKYPPDRAGKLSLFGDKFGVCSAPAVAGDRVYVLTGAGQLLCLNANGLAAGNQGPFREEGRYLAGKEAEPLALLPTDADIIWIYDLVKELNIIIHDVSSCAPLVHDGYVYLETSNGVNKDHVLSDAPDAPSFIVVDAKTGRLAAKDQEQVGRRVLHCLWSPPSLGVVKGRPLVFFGGGDGVCYAFEMPVASPAASATGPAAAPDSVPVLRKVWSYDCIPPAYKMLDGRPINYREGDKRKKNSASQPYNKNDGTYVGPSEIIATPVFYHDRVYVAIGQDPAHGRGRGVLHCIDATQTGDITQSGKIWAFDQIERSLSGVAIADGRLYAADLAGHVYCLDPDTGKCFWTFDMKEETWSTPLVADGKVYIGTYKGLCVLAAGPEARELARIKLDSPSNGTVVAANGTLFIASQKFLWAVRQDPAPKPE